MWEICACCVLKEGGTRHFNTFAIGSAPVQDRQTD